MPYSSLHHFFEARHGRLRDVAGLGGDDLVDQAVVHRLLRGHEEVAVTVVLRKEKGRTEGGRISTDMDVYTRQRRAFRSDNVGLQDKKATAFIPTWRTV